MGITDIFRENNGTPLEVSHQPSANDTYRDNDVIRIILEGEAIELEAGATETEWARALSALAGQIENQDRLKEAAEYFSGRIARTGMGLRNKEIAQRTEKRKAENEARRQVLLALQAQLDALDAEIERLDGEISALHEILEIIDSGEPLDPNNPAHRAILKRSGLPEDKWGTLTRADVEDAIEARKKRRNDITEQREELQAELSAAAPEELEATAETAIDRDGAATLAGMSRELTEERQAVVDAEVGQAWSDGNDGRDNGTADFAMFGAAPDAPSTQTTSAADQYGGENPLRGRVPDIQEHHRTAAADQASAEPEAKVELQLVANGAPFTTI